MKTVNVDIGLLLLRLFFGLSMAFAHGLPKLMGFNDISGSFPDPLGIGSSLSLISAIGTELVCATALTLGAYTRLMTIPLAFTMAVAAFLVHADDPYKKKELALSYLVAYVCLFFMGPGKFSVAKFLPTLKR